MPPVEQHRRRPRKREPLSETIAATDRKGERLSETIAATDRKGEPLSETIAATDRQGERLPETIAATDRKGERLPETIAATDRKGERLSLLAGRPEPLRAPPSVSSRLPDLERPHPHVSPAILASHKRPHPPGLPPRKQGGRSVNGVAAVRCHALPALPAGRGAGGVGLRGQNGFEM